MGKRPLRVGDYTVERHHVRWVEAELRRHNWRKQRLRILEEGIVRASSMVEPGMPRPSGVSNPTHGRALALMTDTEVAHLREMLQIIDDVYKELTPLQQDIIRMLYFGRRYTLEGVALKLERDVETIMRHRNRALVGFAITLIGEWAVQNANKMPISGPEPEV